MTTSIIVKQPFCADDHDSTSLSAEQALERILAAIIPLAADAVERLPLQQALDRVLAMPIVAEIDVPPLDNSAMDGYALNGDDLPEQGVRQLTVVGDSFAGHPFLGNCQSGECVRIMTGAVLPAGLNTVIPQEHIECIDSCAIRIDGRTGYGDNVRSAGEDICQGQTVLVKGRRITAADLGLLASLGIAEVVVTRRLRVAFFTTGDELRSVGESLKPGQIYDSNRYTLYAMLSHQHCLISDLGVVQDDPSALRAVLQQAVLDHDVIISSGGVSVGAADYVGQVFRELGDVNFWKVAIKPGRPLIFGYLQQALFFGLPGNPVAVMVNFSQFVQPALQRLAGETVALPLLMRAVTSSALRKRAGRTEYQRGILSQATDGRLIVSKTGAQGSGILLSMSLANCFIVLQAEQTRLEAGAEVLVQPFAGWI